MNSRHGENFQGFQNNNPQPYPPPNRDDAIMMATLERIERKLNLLLDAIPAKDSHSRRK